MVLIQWVVMRNEYASVTKDLGQCLAHNKCPINTAAAAAVVVIKRSMVNRQQTVTQHCKATIPQ